jgi:hypothetical protein
MKKKSLSGIWVGIFVFFAFSCGGGGKGDTQGGRTKLFRKNRRFREISKRLTGF